MKKKSLQFKLVLTISSVFLILITLVTIIEFSQSKKMILSTMENSGKQTVTIHAQNLSSWVQSRLSQVEVIANTELVSTMDYNRIYPYFERERKNYKGVFNSFGLSDAKGNLRLGKNVVVDISTESTFPLVMKGQNIISNPFPSKEDSSKWIISMECPVKNHKGDIIGLVSGACLVSTVFEENTNFHIGKTDVVYIMDKNGTILYHPNKKLIKTSNLIESENIEYSKTLKKALLNNNYFSQYKDNKTTKMIFSSRVSGTDWFMFLEVPTKEYTSGLSFLFYTIVIVAILAIVILILIVSLNLKSFFKRLSGISSMTEEVAYGNLTCSLPETSDELGRINKTFNKMIDNLKNIIFEIKNVSKVVINSSDSYKNVSNNVIEEGKQVKKAVSELINGSKNTSIEINNITISVNDMEIKAKELVEISTNIDKLIADTKLKTLNGSKSLNETVNLLYQMKESVSGCANQINNLSKDSEKIEDITNIIASISEQTNLLALNAAIEAARAGHEGKGFAVVADEVKKLANQSAVSTGDISDEIRKIRKQIKEVVETMKESLRFVGLGTNSIDTVLTSFVEIKNEVEDVKKMSTYISEIAKKLLDENEKITQAVTVTSEICKESVANTEYFEEIISTQENLFLDLKGASENLDELSSSLSSQLSQFRTE